MRRSAKILVWGLRGLSKIRIILFFALLRILRALRVKKMIRMAFFHKPNICDLLILFIQELKHSYFMQLYSPDLESKLHLLALQQGVQKIVVGAVILNGDLQKVLLLKRHPSDFMPDLEELPSGGVEHGETLFAALTREVKEETGLEITESCYYLNHFDYTSQKGRLTRQFNFLVKTKTLSPITLIPNEHSSYAWQPLDQKGNLSKEMGHIFDLLLAYSE